MDKKPPPISEVAKKQDWIDKFSNDPDLKQQVSTLSTDPEFAAAYDYVQRARRAHKGHEKTTAKVKAEALALADEIRAEKPQIGVDKLAEEILPQLPKHNSGRSYGHETVADWLSGQKPKK